MEEKDVHREGGAIIDYYVNRLTGQPPSLECSILRCHFEQEDTVVGGDGFNRKRDESI